MAIQDADIGKLRQRAALTKPNSAMNLMLAEITQTLALVDEWVHTPTSGTAVAKYDAAGGPTKYTVTYQSGDVGNLVHELTHVAVNESFERDFVNYASAAANIPARTLDGKGRCTNEELRQGCWMNNDANERVITELQTLSALAMQAGLKGDQTGKVTNKLVYGMQNAHKEHHTVLNQILVWMVEWGYPVVILSSIANPRHPAAGPNIPANQPANKFYLALEAAVRRAYDARAAARA